MKYIIIEKFRKDKIKQLYRRFEKQGRLLPEGLLYLDSWIDEKVSICYQLIETHSADCIKEWIAKWD